MRPRSDESDALTESVFDRELKAALEVEPSPEFLARVRTQLANEPESSAWRLPWAFAAAGVVAVAVVAITVTSRLDAPRISTSADLTLPADSSATTGAQNLPPAIAEPGRVAAAASRPALAGSGVVRTSRSAGGDSKPLELIISPDEVRGLRHLIAMASEEDARLESLLAGPTVLATVGPDGEMTLPPITIEPLIPETDSDTQ